MQTLIRVSRNFYVHFNNDDFITKSPMTLKNDTTVNPQGK